MIEFKIYGEFEKIFLTGNLEKVNIVYRELEKIGLNSQVVEFSVLQQWQIEDFKDAYVVICHNKFNEYLKYLAILSRNEKELGNQCVSQFEFYSILAKRIALKMKKNFDISYQISNSMLISLQFGLVLGGVETWAANMYYDVKKKTEKVWILDIKYLTSKFQYVGAEFYGIPDSDIVHLDAENGFFNNVIYICRFLYNAKPRYIIENGSIELLTALIIYKRNHEVDVIHVVHSDSEFMYQQCLWYEEIIDSFLCVSSEIYEKLVIRLSDRQKDCSVFIQYPNVPMYKKKQEIKNGINIAYAARLDRKVKRSHYIIDLIEKMEKENINYRLYIAGGGECLEEICKFVVNNNLFDRVQVYGILSFFEMQEFWKDKHIFLNFSIKEGMSLSLLEAMSQGVVPIVTETSGVRNVIDDNKSGFIVNGIDEMVKTIIMCSRNPQIYQSISQNAYQVIRKGYIKNKKENEKILLSCQDDIFN